MRHKKILTIMIAIGMSSTTFAKPRATIKESDVKPRIENAHKDAERAFKSLGIEGAELLLRKVVEADVKISVKSGLDSKVAESLKLLGETINANLGTKTLYKEKVENSLREMANSLDLITNALDLATSKRRSLTDEALVLAGFNEAIPKLLSEAIKGDGSYSFENITKFQEILKDVDFSDKESVDEAISKILTIAKKASNNDDLKLEEIIRCRV